MRGLRCQSNPCESAVELLYPKWHHLFCVLYVALETFLIRPYLDIFTSLKDSFTVEMFFF